MEIDVYSLMNAKSIKLSLTAMFSALTIIGAQIKVFIPFSPVPITMQTLFTYLSGFLLGGKLGALSQVIYVFLGLTGLPVFAKGGGMQYLLGPTGGYLIGFIFSTYFIGTMTELTEDPGFLNFLLFSSVGTAIIYFFGVSVHIMSVNFIDGKWMKADNTLISTNSRRIKNTLE